MTRSQASAQLDIVQNSIFDGLPMRFPEVLENEIGALFPAGTALPDLEKEAKELAKQVVAAILKHEGLPWKLLVEGEVQFTASQPKPDCFIVEAEETRTDADSIYGRCVGALEWKKPSGGTSAGQPSQYLDLMLKACPWRENAFVIVFNLTHVQIFDACLWRRGRFGLKVACSRKFAVLQVSQRKAGASKVMGVDVNGLAVLRTALLCLRSPRLPRDIVGAMGFTEPVHADACALRLLGVGTSASVCGIRHGEVECCLKTVRQPHYTKQHRREVAALQVINELRSNGAELTSFPSFIASHMATCRILTTPVVTPLRQRGRARSVGFQSYARLVDDLAVLHASDPPVLHCDIAPHNLGWWCDEEGHRHILLFDFGCAVIADSTATCTAPYSGSLWYASTSATEATKRSPTCPRVVDPPKRATRSW